MWVNSQRDGNPDEYR